MDVLTLQGKGSSRIRAAALSVRSFERGAAILEETPVLRALSLRISSRRRFDVRGGSDRTTDERGN
jgi:hypothetical protein